MRRCSVRSSATSASTPARCGCRSGRDQPNDFLSATDGVCHHVAPFVVLAAAFAIEWLPNMRRKDRSLARFPEFAAYRARTALLVPWVL
jgi:hypothetical protein